MATLLSQLARPSTTGSRPPNAIGASLLLTQGLRKASFSPVLTKGPNPREVFLLRVSVLLPRAHGVALARVQHSQHRLLSGSLRNPTKATLPRPLLQYGSTSSPTIPCYTPSFSGEIAGCAFTNTRIVLIHRAPATTYFSVRSRSVIMTSRVEPPLLYLTPRLLCGNFHLRYDGDARISLFTAPQLVKVKLVRTCSAAALRCNYLLEHATTTRPVLGTGTPRVGEEKMYRSPVPPTSTHAIYCKSPPLLASRSPSVR